MKELAVAVVGLGFGANHARVLGQVEGARLAAVCDSSASRLAAAAQHSPAYDDVDEMLRREPLEAVVIAVPARAHLPVALKAIAAGCAVLVEKPMASSYEEGLSLVREAEKAGVPLMAGYIERFNPAVQELKRRLDAGEAGRIIQVSARRMAPKRIRTQDVNVVHDSAIHDIDAMLHLLAAEVDEVYALAQAGVLDPAEDSIAGLLRFALQGAHVVGSLDVNWLSPRRIRELGVLGEKGLFQLDYAAQTLEFFPAVPPSNEVAPPWSAPRRAAADGGRRIHVEPREQLLLELEAFVQALRSGAPLPVPGREALASLAVADALTESARSGRPVRPRRD